MDVATTLSAISTAKDFAALIIGRKIDSAVTEKAIELQNSIIALQSGLLEMQANIQALAQQKTDLEFQVAAFKKWTSEDAEHQLCTVAAGVHVYVSKSTAKTKAEQVWFCTNCWQNQRKSVLQRSRQDFGGTSYYCPSCDANIYDHTDSATISL